MRFNKKNKQVIRQKSDHAIFHFFENWEMCGVCNENKKDNYQSKDFLMEGKSLYKATLEEKSHQIQLPLRYGFYSKQMY